MIQSRSASRFEKRWSNGPGDICGTTVGNKDEEFETFWDLREYRMGDYMRWLRGLLSHFDRQMLFPLVFLVNAGPYLSPCMRSIRVS